MIRRDKASGPARRVGWRGPLLGDRSLASTADLRLLGIFRPALQASHLRHPARLAIVLAASPTPEVMAHYAL